MKMIDTPVMRRWLFAVAGSAAVAVLGLTHAAAQGGLATSLAQGPTVAVESQAGANPSVSSDGRFVVYAGPPRPNGDERASTVWLRDRSNGGEVELTIPQAGVRLGNSVFPVISGDGCYAAVLTEMPFDLFRDDDNDGRWDVYRMKLPSCGGTLNGWELISTDDYRGGDQAAADDIDPRFPPAVSGSWFGDRLHASVRRLATRPRRRHRRRHDQARRPARPLRTRCRHADRSTEQHLQYAGLREPSVSDDGQFVAFTSDANSSKATADWSSGQIPGDFASSQVYVWDRLNPDRQHGGQPRLARPRQHRQR